MVASYMSSDVVFSYMVASHNYAVKSGLMLRDNYDPSAEN